MHENAFGSAAPDPVVGLMEKGMRKGKG